MPRRVPMTAKQRNALLTLPDTEELVVRYHSLSAADLATISTAARTPETRLGFALQLCALRYPGRHLREGEVLPAIMLDHIAEQVGIASDALAAFGRRSKTRYDQLASLKQRFGYRDASDPLRRQLTGELALHAIGTTSGRVLLDELIARMRERKIVIPGVSVIERMAAEAMHLADRQVVGDVAGRLSADQRRGLDALLADKRNDRKSQLSWLKEPPGRVGAASLGAILDKLDVVQHLKLGDLAVPAAFTPRMTLMAKEGVRLVAQAFQQMGADRRHAMLVATVQDLEATLIDSALDMFGALVARANLRAKKRLEIAVAASADQGRERLARIGKVLEAYVKAARKGDDVCAAVDAVATLDVIAADAALLRRTTAGGKPDIIAELAAEHRVFRQVGPRLVGTVELEGSGPSAPLRKALAVLVKLGGDGRRPLPADVPLGHIERRWHRHVIQRGKVDRTYWELATWFALAEALKSGAIWAPASRTHRSLDDLLALPPARTAALATAGVPTVVPIHAMTADQWLAGAEAELDAALLATARELGNAGATCGRTGIVFDGDRLRFPRIPREIAGDDDAARATAGRLYGMVPTTRITDIVAEVARWTGFLEHFGHVSTGLPPSADEERAFQAVLIAESTNLGLSRMAEVCGVASRRTLIRLQTWHAREENFRAGTACLTDAIHAEPVAQWFGDSWRASADGQHFELGGPGIAGGRVNAHYHREPVVKIHTAITGQYAPYHNRVIAATESEAWYTLDGPFGHEAQMRIGTVHTDGGGVSDMIFATAHLSGIAFEPRIPRLSDRRLYAFEHGSRYGRMAPLFGRPLDRQLIRDHWPDIMRMIAAIGAGAVVPSLVLKKLSSYPRQNGLSAALREIGRVQRTLFTLRWLADSDLRALVTAELNKGEARNSLSRAVAFHRLGRFRDRGHENQGIRAAALNLMTAAIILWNCRYLSRAIAAAEATGVRIEPAQLAKLSPLAWDHINLTGDYIWSDGVALDADGFMPLRMPGR
jgi:TnpA family transposase